MSAATAATKKSFVQKFGGRIIVLLLAICIIQHLMLREKNGFTVTSLSSPTSIDVVKNKTDDTTVATSTVNSILCNKNPYLGALEPLPIISEKMDHWFNNIQSLGTKAMQPDMYQHDYNRFFPFSELTPCNEKSCIGGDCSADESKIVCGISELQKQEHCIVYSIGGNNQWHFEIDILKNTPCEVHTFDCTGDRSRFTVPKKWSERGRLHFHHVCLVPYPQDPNAPHPAGMVGESWTLLEMQQKLGHARIDLLKVDIEGFEFPLINSWPELVYKEQSENVLLPMQILMEIHYQTYFDALHPDIDDWKTATDLLEFQIHLMRMGYVVTVRDDNPVCKHCTEVTLIRARCPNTGIYENY